MQDNCSNHLRSRCTCHPHSLCYPRSKQTETAQGMSCSGGETKIICTACCGFAN
jgi:hypothetical protein